jgi:hypothetical protein
MGAFSAPTLDEARNTPGYKFTQEAGNQGILAGASALGGNISGNTFQALDKYNTGLADSTYNDVFNRALSGYQTNLGRQQQNFGQDLSSYNANLAGQNQEFNQGLAGYNANLQDYQARLAQYQAGLQGYGAELSGYQTALSAQNQGYNQLYNIAALGAGTGTALNSNNTANAVNVGNLMTGIGNAQASGAIGQANAISSGLGTAVNGVTGALNNYNKLNTLSQLMGGT